MIMLSVFTLSVALLAPRLGDPIAEIVQHEKAYLRPSGRGDRFVLAVGETGSRRQTFLDGQGEPNPEPVEDDIIPRPRFTWSQSQARQLKPALDSSPLPPRIIEAIYAAGRAAYVGDSPWYQTSKQAIHLWNGTEFARIPLPPLPAGATIAAAVSSGPATWITWIKRDPNERRATQPQTIQVQGSSIVKTPSPEKGLGFIPVAHYGRFTYGGAIELRRVDDFLPEAPNKPYRLFAWNGARFLAIQPTESEYPWRMLGEAKGWVYARQLSAWGVGVYDFPGDKGGQIYRWPVGNPARVEPVEIRRGPGEVLIQAVILPDAGRLGVQIKSRQKGVPDKFQVYVIQGSP
jgi:hypothetical protein